MVCLLPSDQATATFKMSTESTSEMFNERLKINATLFTGAPQHDNFNRYYEIYPSGKVPHSSQPMSFEMGDPIILPSRFSFGGQSIQIRTFLEETDTAALLVLKDSKIRHEVYSLTGGPDVKWLSMSVAKSILSALLGVAIQDGLIKSIEEPITNYVKALIGSAYDGVRIKDILQMSSGASWDENYSDRDSDIVRFSTCFGRGDSLNEFAATLTREFEPGAVNRYNSVDTQVLGMLLNQIIEQSITDYTSEKLWEPMGAEFDAYWLRDNLGMEMVFGGFNATARDYAKIGQLYLNGGELNGHQIIPANWVLASTTPDGEHVQTGRGTPGEFSNMGYGYHWWIPEGNAEEFSAVGVYLLNSRLAVITHLRAEKRVNANSLRLKCFAQ